MSSIIRFARSLRFRRGNGRVIGSWIAVLFVMLIAFAGYNNQNDAECHGMPGSHMAATCSYTQTDVPADNNQR